MRIGIPMSVARMETEIAQDAQVILGNALKWLADESDGARSKVIKPAEIVEQLAAIGICIESIDGEIAPPRVLTPVAGEGDRCTAAVGRDVGTKCCDFDHR